MTAGKTRIVFISYRREETRHIAGRLADQLTDRLGSTRVFMDVDAVEPGADFAATIAREVTSCDVLIALIGPTWSTITDRRGRRRLDDPDDFVVLEIRAALEREIRVIPVLVDGAVMPDRYDLPEGLQGLARRSAVRLDHETFRSDVATLLDAVDRILPTLAQMATEPTIRTSALAADQVAEESKADQTADQTRKTPAPTGQWRADVSRRSPRRLQLTVKLTNEEHCIEVTSGNWNRVTVDGAEATRDSNWTKSTFKFSLTDAAVLHECELTVRYTAVLLVTILRFSVGNRVLHVLSE